MGGIGSGRGNGRPTVDGALTLDIAELFRKGSLRRGVDYTSCWKWTDSYSGALVAEVIIVGCMSDVETAHLRLIHRRDDRTTADYRVLLESTEQPFGGTRWWFTCPSTGRRVGTLHQPRGACGFASRQAWGLGYRSQRLSPRDRAIRKMHKLQRRLGGDPGRPSVPIEKPAGMHWATFDQKVAEMKTAEARACAFLVPAIDALQRRWAKSQADFAST